MNNHIYIKQILGAGAVVLYAERVASLKRLKNECVNGAAILQTYTHDRGIMPDNSQPGGFQQTAQYKPWHRMMFVTSLHDDDSRGHKQAKVKVMTSSAQEDVKMSVVLFLLILLSFIDTLDFDSCCCCWVSFSFFFLGWDALYNSHQVSSSHLWCLYLCSFLVLCLFSLHSKNVVSALPAPGGGRLRFYVHSWVQGFWVHL